MGHYIIANHFMTKEEFTQGVSGWDNHRYLLWEALEKTKLTRLPVLELGCGDGSTPFLKRYCKDNELELFSYDYNKEWADKYGAIHVPVWNKTLDIWSRNYSVVLVDESPGEHRKESLILLKGNALIIVAHDTEPAADHGYKMRTQLANYKYWKDYETVGAWASMVSDMIDIR